MTPRSTCRGSGSAGLVTAELAACLPVLVLLLGVGLSAVSVGGAAVRAQDAAREVARAASRGDMRAGLALAQLIAPGAAVQVRTSGSWVVVTARLRVRPFVDGPTVTVRERSASAREPTGPAP